MDQGTCSFPECGKPRKTRGWCQTHYCRWLKYGDPSVVHRTYVCSVDGCEGKHKARGLCDKHVRRLRNNGDPLITRPPSGGQSPGPEHSSWVGDAITYKGAHHRVRLRRGSASQYACTCGRPAMDWAYDHADPDELLGDYYGRPRRYSADPDHYLPMCRSCHRKFDYKIRDERSA